MAFEMTIGSRKFTSSNHRHKVKFEKQGIIYSPPPSVPFQVSKEWQRPPPKVKHYRKWSSLCNSMTQGQEQVQIISKATKLFGSQANISTWHNIWYINPYLFPKNKSNHCNHSELFRTVQNWSAKQRTVSGKARGCRYAETRVTFWPCLAVWILTSGQLALLVQVYLPTWVSCADEQLFQAICYWALPGSPAESHLTNNSY